MPDILLNKLQRVQNTAARLVRIVPRFCHITPALRSLHWLHVKLRSTFKILGITSKAINSFAPNYISSLIKTKQPTIYSLRSNNDLLYQ